MYVHDYYKHPLYALFYAFKIFLKIIRLLNSKTPCEYFLLWQILFKISIKLGSILFAQHQGPQLINYFHQSPKMHFKL
jgi:hypothetical protein